MKKIALEITILTFCLLYSLTSRASMSDDEWSTENAGPYVTLWLGVGHTENLVTRDITNNNNRLTLVPHFGTNGEFGAGYKWSNLRGDISGAYLRNNIKQVTDEDGTQTSPNGRLFATTLMANGYYDFDNESKAMPYVGVGLGLARVRASVSTAQLTDIMQDSRTMAAYQATIGLGYWMIPDLLGSIDYRYLGTAKTDYIVRDRDGTGTVNASARYYNHLIRFGLSFFIE